MDHPGSRICGPHVIDWDLLAAASSYQMGHLASDAENAHNAVAAIMAFDRNDHGRGNNIVDALFMFIVSIALTLEIKSSLCLD